MSNSFVSRILRKVAVLAIMCAALVVFSQHARKASACDTCWNESRAVYTYCSQNPDGYFVGCEYDAYCSDIDWQMGASHLYTETCCGVDAPNYSNDPMHEAPWYWKYYCL